MPRRLGETRLQFTQGYGESGPKAVQASTKGETSSRCLPRVETLSIRTKAKVPTNAPYTQGSDFTKTFMQRGGLMKVASVVGIILVVLGIGLLTLETQYDS